MGIPIVEQGKEIDMNNIGSTGDFMGGIVGIIWSLAEMENDMYVYDLIKMVKRYFICISTIY
ncbi:hypothetical protein GCM10009122_09060 [Fulvivirga kasyanovii]|uniref:Uncharacterized protein n=1 Tax=Fulvivirga kasyanovii TaxID=396812 RepID=A0ABW9S0E0_9BACT|nr:hypothetical protein [Fulvivirga kasyanovii]